MFRNWLAVVCLCACIGGAAWGAEEELLRTLNSRPHEAPLVVPSAYVTQGEFALAPGHAKPVYLYLQAILKYRALSHSGGVLRFSLNGQPVGPAESVNKAEEYWQKGNHTYAPQSFALPAQPSFASGEREDLGGMGYLFDISKFVKPGQNTVQITHVAATEEALLRDAMIIVDGQQTPLSLSAPRVSENDPQKLVWDFSPNTKEKKGLFLCQGTYQRLSFYNRNDDTAGAVKLGLVLEMPAGVELVTPYLPYGDGWTKRIRMETSTLQREGQAFKRYIFTFPESASVPAMTQWHTFGGHPFSLYLRCNLAPGVYSMQWQAVSQGGAGKLTAAPLTVLPTPPAAVQSRRSMLGVWAYGIVQPGVSEAEKALEAQIRKETNAQLAALGVSRLVLSYPREIPEARAHGMLVSLASPWGYNTTVYPCGTTDLSKARLGSDGKPLYGDNGRREFQWCPTYAAEHVDEAFGPITSRIRDEGWDGFDLDHEGNHQQCYCARCKAAFLSHEKLAEGDLNWPDDAAAGGKLRARWLQFHVWNGGRHVAAVRQAVKAGNEQAKLFSWFTMSQYERQATGPHLEAYGKRLEEEMDYGYDVREFLKHLDYANMANGVYPQDEKTWERPYGLNWAFNRVQSTVDNEWKVPLAPCLNIGAGVLDHYTNPDYLRWQAKTHVAQGVKGMDFWMLPFFDGRHYALLSELARLFAATQDIVWDGERADEMVKVTGGEGIFCRAFAAQDKLLVGITNRGTNSAKVTIQSNGKNGKMVLSGAKAAATLEVPALDGVFILYDLP
ncbi:MAG: hypothetical protein ACYC63_03765 [Armatimonadota bacterium]